MACSDRQARGDELTSVPNTSRETQRRMIHAADALQPSDELEGQTRREHSQEETGQVGLLSDSCYSCLL